MDASLAAISNASLKQNLPNFAVGQTVRIHQRIKEGEKERIQVFEGIIIKVSNGTGIGGTITVRKVVDGIGVERVFAIHSPFISKIEVTKQAKVRRSKLYYLRSRTGKAARLKTTLLEGQVFEPTAVTEEAPAEDAEAPALEGAAAESPAEEAQVETPAPEAKAEEAPAEEPKAEEAPVEEAKADESSEASAKKEEKEA